MSDFKAKMHQIRFRLGLRPIPRWAPRPSSWILGGLLLRGGEGGREREGEGGEGWGKGGEGDGGEGEGRDGEGGEIGPSQIF